MRLDPKYFALLLCPLLAASAIGDDKVFRAGAYAIDVTPTKFPVIVSGGFLADIGKSAVDKLHARCLVLDDGQRKIGIVVVDSLMMPRDFLDGVKKDIHEATGIPPDHLLISATHTHSAPAVMGCLGTPIDRDYRDFLGPHIVRGMQQAVKTLQPAKVGWTLVDDPEHTHNRRWIYRADKMLTDPFGERTVRANMHPGHQNPNAVGPSGPVDTGLGLLSLQTPDGKPLALLGNYSMHYYGHVPVSPDWCGRFCQQLEKKIGGVAIMSQGTSGDLMWMDYGVPAPKRDFNAFADAVAAVANEAYRKITYRDWVPLDVRQTTLKLNRRTPDEQRMAWARKILEKAGEKPKNMQEVYAREQVILHENPTVELILQAIRVGDLGITALPNEVFAITGLKLKAQSPFAQTMNIELANGAEGYIPPPEQHHLGGYTTWPARTAALEVGAEPKIVEATLGLLDQAAGRKRRVHEEVHGPYAKAVLASKPIAYWRLGEFGGDVAHDSSGNGNHATIDKGVAFYLDGPPRLSGEASNRCVHLAGGKIQATIKGLGEKSTIETWVWSGVPNDVGGTILQRGNELLSISRDPRTLGRLLFDNGDPNSNRGARGLPMGTAAISPKTWRHLVLVRDAGHLTIYLDGQVDLSDRASNKDAKDTFTFGHSEGGGPWQGKLDEIAIYNRALSPQEIADHFDKSQPEKAAAVMAAVPPSPEEMLKTFHLPPGYKMEVVAAEPDVQSPVAMTFDDRGRLFVVEMLDYPNGPGKGNPPAGRIRLLEEKAGKFTAKSVFAENLLFANGVMPWNGGLIVTAAPNILFLKDTTGAGHADVQKFLYTGFAVGNPQLRVSHPNLGLDNWIYVANGMQGGTIKSRERPSAAPVDIRGRDFRFDLVHGRGGGDGPGPVRQYLR